MKMYAIYAGLNGGFGGATYQFEDRFASEEEALEAAYESAIEQYNEATYDSGVRSYPDVLADYMAEHYPEYDPEIEDLDNLLTQADWAEINDEYNNEVESWVDYYVQEVPLHTYTNKAYMDDDEGEWE